MVNVVEQNKVEHECEVGKIIHGYKLKMHKHK